MHRESDEVRKLSAQDSTLAIVSNHPGDHTVYLALFNQSTTDKIVPVDLRETRIVDSCQITNLWTGEALGSRKSNFEVSLAPHASVLFHLTH